MHVFVTGGTGHSGPYIISELIAAGHEVTALARSDAAAAAVAAVGAKVRRGDLEDLDGLKEAAAQSDGVIHVAHRQDLLPTGGLAAVAAAETSIMLAYGEALAGTGKPLVVSGSIGSPGWENLGRPATEADPALPGGDAYKGTLRVRNIVETTVIGLAERGVRSSIVRIPPIMHSTTDSAGFVPLLIGLAKEKGVIGYPGDGKNRWSAAHVRDVAALFRLALEKGEAGRNWHAVSDEGIPFREIAEAIGNRLNLPAVPIPADVLMLPGYFGFLANLVTLDVPASNAITRRTLGWEPTEPRLLADLDNGHYFPAGGRAEGARPQGVRRTATSHGLPALPQPTRKLHMSTISIIGSGSMAAAIGGRTAKAGHTVEVVSRDTKKAQALADQLASGATAGRYGAAPAGDIVILAVPYAGAAAVVTDFGDALDGKVIIDVTNPVAHDLSGLVTAHGSSAAQETAKGLPAGAHVVKAFNTIFGHVLAKGGHLDAFIAADDAQAKARVATFLESLGLRPLDVGGLHMAQTLEALGLMMIGLAKNGAGSWDIAMKVDIA